MSTPEPALYYTLRMIVPEAMHVVRIVRDDGGPVIIGFVQSTKLRMPREDTHGRFPTEEKALAVARIVSNTAFEHNPQVTAAREALAKAQRAQRDAVDGLLAQLCHDTLVAGSEAVRRVGKTPELGAPCGVIQETDA